VPLLKFKRAKHASHRDKDFDAFNLLIDEQLRVLRGDLRKQLTAQCICPGKPWSRELPLIVHFVALVYKAAAGRTLPDHRDRMANLAVRGAC